MVETHGLLTTQGETMDDAMPAVAGYSSRLAVSAAGSSASATWT